MWFHIKKSSLYSRATLFSLFIAASGYASAEQTNDCDAANAGCASGQEAGAENTAPAASSVQMVLPKKTQVSPIPVAPVIVAPNQ